ncbi:ribosomal L7Ae/L30e/S12e/Gadd45 family protein [Nanoarchaeota archaeon]
MKIAITELKKLIKDKKLVIGKENCLKKLKGGNLEKVLLTSNMHEDDEKVFNKYGKLVKTEILKATISNVDLGTLCKKPFPISVIGVIKS